MNVFQNMGLGMRAQTLVFFVLYSRKLHAVL